MDNIEFAGKIIAQAKCLAIAPEEAIIETMSKAAAALTVQEKCIEELKSKLAYLEDRNCGLEQTITNLADHANGDYWAWQGDGEDHPESLSCPILIGAYDFRELFNMIPNTVTLNVSGMTDEDVVHLIRSGTDDYDRATSNGEEDDYDRAMSGV